MKPVELAQLKPKRFYIFAILEGPNWHNYNFKKLYKIITGPKIQLSLKNMFRELNEGGD